MGNEHLPYEVIIQHVMKKLNLYWQYRVVAVFSVFAQLAAIFLGSLGSADTMQAMLTGDAG
jgi:hypothetical protein